MISKFLYSIILALMLTSISAQEINYQEMPLSDYKKPQEYILKEVNVVGIKYLDGNILVNLSGLTIGEKIEIPGEDITNAIQRLWEQGLFSDAKIYVTKIYQDSVSLEFFLQERHRISELEIIGLKKAKENDIREELALKRGMQVTENLINKSERIIKNYLYDKKYLNSVVDIVQIDDTVAGLNNVKLKIHIEKGVKIKIKDINIHGNTVFKESKLKRAMKETKQVNLNFFKGSKYIEKEYNNDKKLIISKYNSEGYRDAEIVVDSVYKVKSKRIAIDIHINEGNQYFFRNIDWVGNTKYTTDGLNRVLKVKKGDPFDTELLNSRLNIDEDAVSGLYLNEGYLFFNASPTIQKIENDSIDIQMRITEGKRFSLNKIVIKGNSKTNEHIIRRELRTMPGQLFSKSEIMRSQRDLAQLGYFDPEQFGIEPTNINQAEGLVDLEYTVVEKSTDQLELSGGWGNNMFVGTLGLRFSNFSARNIFKKGAWSPVPSGDGQNLSLRAQTNGQYYSAYSASFVEPWLGGKKPISFSVSAYYTTQKNTNYLYEAGSEFMKIFGATVGIGKRLKVPDDYFTLSTSLGYQRYYLNDWSYFIFQNGASNNLSLTTSFARNSTDQIIYPRTGSSFALTLQLTPPYSLFKDEDFWKLTTEELEDIEAINQEISDRNIMNLADPRSIIIPEDVENAEKYKWIEYHKWKYKGSWYLKIWKDLVLATNTEFGYLGYYNENIGYSPFGKFELGGDGMSGYSLYGVDNIALRGYENGSLTPRNASGMKLGNVYEKINFELRYPISLKPQATIYVLGFIEAGNAWSSMDEFNPFDIKRSAGIGLRAFLPMFGLLGIDYGYGFDEIPFSPDANGSQFHFVIGQQF
ncbi:MAG: outer membrane protein assembly factor BamA [Bacteroidales bacterium]|jgi:outer membrane protein insertion porin family|nr:outer membrane protein assembly factor BamA [Bacteroidales bacterium]